MSRQDWGKPHKIVHMPEEDIRQELKIMEDDPALDTRVSLVKTDGVSFNLMTFQEKHLAYLQKHPKTNPAPYLMNLKTMIKIRTEK